MQVVQQRMLRLGQSIPDTLYMVSGTLEKNSRSKDNSRSVVDLGYRERRRSRTEDHGFYRQSRRSNSLSQG